MDNGVSIRKYPYPYRAALAICSDLDLTLDRHVYFETAKFLNTTQETRMGEGVGLEVGNSIYFDMPPGHFSYWNTDDEGRETIRAHIRSGHIDCLHSFGDLATTRAHAERALEELERHGCHLEVWVDHAKAPSNLGADIMCGSGDILQSPVFHADITCKFGVKYVWRGRVTSVIGQNAPRNLNGIFNRQCPLVSTKTVVKEFGKGILAQVGYPKYAMHSQNEVLRETKLRSGNHVMEFIRSNPYWGGVEHGATADCFENVLTKSILDRLCEREGILILYTHLGKSSTPDLPFGNGTRNAFSLLARYRREGKILVTTTRRLLGFCASVWKTRIAAAINDGKTSVLLEVEVGNGDSRSLPQDLAGYTIYVPDPDKTRVFVNKREVLHLDCNGPDHTGRTSISIPWPSLQFPSI